MLFLSFLDTQRNEFPINLGTLKIHYFLPKLLESYGKQHSKQPKAPPRDILSTKVVSFWGRKSSLLVRSRSKEPWWSLSTRVDIF